jgi:hypothetical protein
MLPVLVVYLRFLSVVPATDPIPATENEFNFIKDTHHLPLSQPISLHNNIINTQSIMKALSKGCKTFCNIILPIIKKRERERDRDREDDQ